MITALEFLTEFCKELILSEPMDRQKIVAGYAKHMEARETAIWNEIASTDIANPLKANQPQKEKS